MGKYLLSQVISQSAVVGVSNKFESDGNTTVSGGDGGNAGHTRLAGSGRETG
jgi:hypothetical protein